MTKFDLIWNTKREREDFHAEASQEMLRSRVQFDKCANGAHLGLTGGAEVHSIVMVWCWSFFPERAARFQCCGHFNLHSGH